VLQNVDLSEVQVSELVVFLKSLTDPCVKDRSCLTKWIVEPVNDADPNGDQLNALDSNGNLL
jgi:cytochrome c peroxidase